MYVNKLNLSICYQYLNKKTKILLFLSNCLSVSSVQSIGQLLRFCLGTKSNLTDSFAQRCYPRYSARIVYKYTYIFFSIPDLHV